METASLDLNLLRTFLAVYRSGSFTGAARLLGLSQPTVTTQMRALERQTGRELFERLPRGVTPTPVADELAARIAAPLDELAAVAGPTPPAGTRAEPVHLAGPAELLCTRVLPALAPLIAEGVRLRVATGLTDPLLDELRAGRHDLVIATTRPRGRTVHAVPLTDEEFVLVAAPVWAERLTGRGPARGIDPGGAAGPGTEGRGPAARGAERPGSAVRERDAGGRVVPETGSGAHGRDPAVRDAEGQGPAVGPEQPESAVRSAEYAESAVRSAEQPESAVRSAEYAESAVRGGEVHRAAVRGAERPGSAVRERDAGGRVVPETGSGAHGRDPAVRDAEGQGPAVGPEQPESAVRSAEHAESAVRGGEVHRSAARGAEYAESAVWGGETHRAAVRGAEGAAVAAPGSFDPAVLHDVPLVTYAEDLPIARRYWRHVFGRRLTRTAAVTVPDLRGVLAAVAAGAGFGVLPRYLCQDLLESGALVALLEPGDPPINTGFLVQRPGASDNPDVARVRALLLRAARSW